MPRGHRHAEPRFPKVPAQEEAEAFEKELFGMARTGLEVYGPDLRILRSNAAILALRGMPEAQVVGASLGDLDTRIALSPIMREVLDTHDVVRERTIPAVPADDPGNQHLYSVTGYPLRCDGEVPGAVAAMVHDVTEQVRKQKATDLMAVARSRIGTTLDAPRTAQELADMAVPVFADAVAVDLAESVFDGDAPSGPSRHTSRCGAPPSRPMRGSTGPIRWAAPASSPPTRPTRGPWRTSSRGWSTWRRRRAPGWYMTARGPSSSSVPGRTR